MKFTSLSLIRSLSVVEPVNSLRQKLQNRPVLRDDWEKSLQQSYRERSLSNAELLEKEKAK